VVHLVAQPLPLRLRRKVGRPDAFNKIRARECCAGFQ
jgi:hypothetical protein